MQAKADNFDKFDKLKKEEKALMTRSFVYLDQLYKHVYNSSTQPNMFANINILQSYMISEKAFLVQISKSSNELMKGLVL